eukprot:386621_1
MSLNQNTSNKALDRLSTALEDMSIEKNLQQKYQHAFKALKLKCKDIKHPIPSSKLQSTLESFNIIHLNKTLTSMAAFVSSDQCSESEIKKKAQTIIQTLQGASIRNKNAHQDAYGRMNRNKNIHNQSHILELDSENNCSDENTETFTDFGQLQKQLEAQKRQQKQQKNQMGVKEWEQFIFGGDIGNNSANKNVKNSMNKNVKNSVDDINNIPIKPIPSQTHTKKTTTTTTTKTKTYGSYKPIDALQKCDWKTTLQGGKKPSQIAVLAAAQSCGFPDGFTHAELIKHTNKLLKVNYTVKSAL